MPLDFSKRWFAWAMWRVAQHYDALLAERKTSLLGSIHGTVVEIGLSLYSLLFLAWADLSSSSLLSISMQRDFRVLITF